MSDRHKGPFKQFRFVEYGFDHEAGEAWFRYAFDDVYNFEERLVFATGAETSESAPLDASLFYTFIVLGTSYYKLFPDVEMKIEQGALSTDQASFFTDLYRGGLSQFVFENALSPSVIQAFKASNKNLHEVVAHDTEGVVALQSGGKDSLLAARLMKERGHSFDALHMSSTGKHPSVIDKIDSRNVVDVTRHLDLDAIQRARVNGGLNGHVPFSAITAGVALIDAVLRKKSIIVAAMEASSDEANTYIGDFEVNHMYSKTFAFERALNRYIHQNIATDIHYVSVIRPFTDLRVAELFVDYCWDDFAHDFASCNAANYKQGEDTGQLSWCGACAKCANSFLLFAPFVSFEDLTGLFNGQNLFAKESLKTDFVALLGLGGVKPFECVGTVDELRAAYHLAHDNDARYTIRGLEVPRSVEDFRAIHPYQKRVTELIDEKLLSTPIS